jgi:predicted ATPase/class 3 adenylate cyclase
MVEAGGTTTFLFTDIEGSTRLLTELGERYAEALEQQQRLIRAAIAEGGGEEIGTEGDSFFVIFPTASGAVATAVAAQRALAAAEWPADGTVRVRMGLHTGEAMRRGDTFVGIAINRAARIAAAAHGGQVLLSDATRTLVEAALPEGVSLRDLGSHRLKDLSAPERLNQLVISGLPDDFPPLHTLDLTPNNLPISLTSFLGREREIAEVTALLEQHRLVTLTGPGGTGKTRLSLEVAAGMTDAFPGGVFWVPLAPLTEVELVAPTIAHALGLADGGGRMPEERILDQIGEKQLLLVLDNFEQLVPAAPLVSQLLTRAPKLRVLVTSRETLHLYGEHEYPVPPLGVPPLSGPSGHASVDARSLSQYEAVRLFIERAMAVRPDFAVTNENAPAVAELCARLDGLPLAIELAAARVRILTPEAILRRLGDRLDLLTGGGPDRPERQQTLRGAIAWSYDLLDAMDRRLFAALSVFVGGTTLEAAEEVCGPMLSGDVLDGLESLVEKSLLRQRTAGDEPRFSFLLTIREFATERARELEIFDQARLRHAEYFARLASEAAALIMGSEKRGWLDRLELEHDNMRAAISCAVEHGNARLALNLVADLWRFWQMRGYLEEGIDRIREALALPAGEELREARLRAIEAAGGVAYWQGDLVAAEHYYQEVLDEQRAAGDEQRVADALYNLSFDFALPGTDGRMSDPAHSRELVGEALEIYRRVGDRAGVARALWALSNSAWTVGDVEFGLPYALESLETFRELGDRFMVAWSLYTLGMMRLLARELDDAGPVMREALGIFSEAQDVSGYVLVLDGLAAEAFLRGDRERSARLAAAVNVLQESSGTGLTPANRQLIGFRHEQLTEDPSLAEAWREGERMTPAEAVAYALEATNPQPLDEGGDRVGDQVGAASSRRGKTTSA